ncbi:MAG: hypothetical protein KAJ19_13990, partial [Gammaproteobacteria bacterium]|nr:hypothetical protein [Gammaproteobacteria bacterium]
EADKQSTKAVAAKLTEEKKIAALVKSLRTPQEVYNDRIEELNELYLSGAIKAENYRRGINATAEALKKASEDGKEANDIGQQLGLTFSSAFEDAIVSGAKFGEILKSIKQDLLRLFIRKAVTEPFAAGASTLFSTALSSIFGGFMAEGGPVTAGKVFAVGEKGPELFKPNQSGTIIPNSALGGGGMGGGGNVYNIDARGADVGAVDRLSSALIALAGPGRVEQRALRAVGKRSARDPRFLGA